MISREDLRRLARRLPADNPVLSVFLDMSVNSDNKRTYQVFLNQRRKQYVELASDREAHHREALGAAFERVELWIDTEFQEANRGAAIYAEIGGEWFEGLQFPVPVRNRTVIADRPIIAPLAQIVEARHHGVILVDRENLRLLSFYLGELLHEHLVQTEPYPGPHDIQRGGEAQGGWQRRREEEVRHFFKEFAQEVAEFDRRYRPDDFVVLGTDENVKHFLEFLPVAIQRKVVHTARPPEAGLLHSTPAEIHERLAGFFLEQAEKQAAATVETLRDRVMHRHLAVAGFADTLEQLQEGKVEMLVLGRDLERTGAQCLRCHFYLDRADATCAYCGGETRDSVDLVEAMVRMAEEREVPVEFVEPEAVIDLGGVGALLRF